MRSSSSSRRRRSRRAAATTSATTRATGTFGMRSSGSAMTTKVLVLGGSGMLGSMVADLLARDEELEVAATARDAHAAGRMAGGVPTVRWEVFDARGVDV